ncbi:MAG: hypothetical protein DSM107014_03510 [Gomphosphaeria aponina SAG 52.96 = DSM 107014]|uniref:Uncharacterized protein n=1 Tax=Gomphosphaeria aponina SAG 52.96 = DSM 107014 TaxID=1521640 RepID=A0A941GQ39_9CHRO|nr:hypothetical protein [Gomphosphaeria aponina SAG 52.96 = DSM 107014]
MTLTAQMRRQFIALAMKRVQPGTGSSLEFLDRRTWVHPVTNLKNIIKQKPFVIVGGVATRLYMPERVTLDLDILVLAKDAPQIYEELTVAGGRKVRELNIPGSQWDLSDGTSLDVLEGNEVWTKKAVTTPNYSPDGQPIISLPYLVLMKLQASRTQDLADVSRMLGGADEATLTDVRGVILKYLPDAREDVGSLIILGKLERSPRENVE